METATVSISFEEYTRLKEIEKKFMAGTSVTVKYIADKLGLTTAAIFMNPCYQPNFGAGFAKGSTRTWPRYVVDEWLAIPLKERKKMYKEFLSRNQQAA